MAILSVNVNLEDKNTFSGICTKLGMNISTAINIFIKAVNRTNGIPFDLNTEVHTRKKELTAENIKEMLSVSTADDFSEKTANIEMLREITKNDVW